MTQRTAGKLLQQVLACDWNKGLNSQLPPAWEVEARAALKRKQVPQECSERLPEGLSADEYRLGVRTLYRCLERLSIAIEDCARIGFEESSPTENEHHFNVWNHLNEAQKSAKENIVAYRALLAALPTSGSK